MSRTWLTPPQRAVLAGIVAGRPDLSHAQVARIFEARTGRKISRMTVYNLRRVGGYRESPAKGRLSDEHKGVLTLLIREAGISREDHVSCREIAEQFLAMTGRSVRPCTVWSHRVERLGMERYGRGTGGGSKPRTPSPPGSTTPR